ncbi:MAG: ABC transporter permease [Planctomycetota bacterium]|jgi:ribose transport system permease protein|nr:ABC transporter permease [Planctomycetota bacterium]
MRTLQKEAPGRRAPEMLRDYGAFIVLFLILAVNALATPNFFRLGTAWNMLLQSFPIIIMSLGMAMVVATGGIDISVGSVMAIGSIIFAKLSLDAGWGILAASLAALAVTFCVGLFNGLLVGKFGFQPIVVTLVTMMVGRGAAAVINDGKIVTFYDSNLVDFGLYQVFGVVPIHIVLIAVAVIAVYLLVKETVFGVYLQAVGDNLRAARLVGVNAFLVILVVYAVNAFLAGFAAIFETARLASADAINLGRLVEMDCVAAVAVGGTPMRGGQVRIVSTLAGALTMQAITTMVNMNNIPYAYSLVIKSVIIVVALSVQKEK